MSKTNPRLVLVMAGDELLFVSEDPSLSDDIAYINSTTAKLRYMLTNYIVDKANPNPGIVTEFIETLAATELFQTKPDFVLSSKVALTEIVNIYTEAVKLAHGVPNRLDPRLEVGGDRSVVFYLYGEAFPVSDSGAADALTRVNSWTKPGDDSGFDVGLFGMYLTTTSIRPDVQRAMQDYIESKIVSINSY